MINYIIAQLSAPSRLRNTSFEMPQRIKATTYTKEYTRILCTIALVLPLFDVCMCCGNCWECCACTFKSPVESCTCESDIVTSTFQSNRCWWRLNLHVFFFPKIFMRGVRHINRMPNIQYPSKSGTILIFFFQYPSGPLLLVTMNCWNGSCPPSLIG